jgi:hypothetical protein
MWASLDGALRSVLSEERESLVVSPSFTFRTDVQLVQMRAKQTRGRVPSSASQIRLAKKSRPTLSRGTPQPLSGMPDQAQRPEPGEIGSRNFRPSTGFIRYPKRIRKTRDRNRRETREAEDENDPP